MRNKKITFGSWITIGHPAIAEIMLKSGYDWLCIDMEHSLINLDQMTSILRSLESNDCFTFVRVGKNDELEIKKVLDSGVKGIIVPQINTKGDAQKLIEFSHYPPKGKRGVGLSRAQDYGRNFEGYKSLIHKELEIIAIIENKQAIENLHDILSVDGITGSMIGPYDLSASYGKPGDILANEVQQAIKSYEFIAKKFDKPFGYHAVNESNKKILEKIKRGYKFIALGFDAKYLSDASDQYLSRIKKAIE